MKLPSEIASMKSDSILYSKHNLPNRSNQDCDSGEIFNLVTDDDDSLPIRMFVQAKAYLPDSSNNSDEAVHASSEVANNTSNNSQSSWNFGDCCWALYYDDKIYYKAEILSVDVDNSTCRVMFHGYDETQETNFCDLRRFTRLDKRIGPNYHTPQKQCDSDVSVKSKHKSCRHRFRAPIEPSGQACSSFKPFLIPPPDDIFNGPKPNCESEVIGSMLMSWYMSGYNSGYYAAVKDQKEKLKSETRKTTQYQSK